MSRPQQMGIVRLVRIDCRSLSMAKTTPINADSCGWADKLIALDSLPLPDGLHRPICIADANVSNIAIMKKRNFIGTNPPI
jgi:hypothetical protein